MAVIGNSALPTTPDPMAVRDRRNMANLLRRPVALFVLLSTLFGVPAIFLNPPLRGADEPAHFLRIYGISHGQLIPSLADEKGRRGLFLEIGRASWRERRSVSVWV